LQELFNLAFGHDPHSGQKAEVSDSDRLFNFDREVEADRDEAAAEGRIALNEEQRDQLAAAIVKSGWFETDSISVAGISEKTFDGERWSGRNRHYYGEQETLEMPAERLLAQPLMKLRVVFQDNKKAHTTQHQKTGKVNGRVLGKRAPAGDERLFKKKVRPTSKSYSVVLILDASASNNSIWDEQGQEADYRNVNGPTHSSMELGKKAVLAQAELLHRLGVDFMVAAHSTDYSSGSEGFMMGLYVVKTWDQVWDKKARTALSAIQPVAGNLDGHAFEYARKQVEGRRSSEHVIMYYSDGKMPAANYDEELEVLQRELKYCKQHRITTMGVGIHTDGPSEHGLPTVQLDRMEDLPKVIKHLEKALS